MQKALGTSLHIILLYNLDDESFSDTTKMSLPELTRLSIKIATKWKIIACLANLDANEIDSVNINHMLYPELSDKAAKILKMFNEKPDFSRKELGDILEEVGLCQLKDELINGRLRRPPNDIGSPLGNSNKITKS